MRLTRSSPRPTIAGRAHVVGGTVMCRWGPAFLLAALLTPFGGRAGASASSSGELLAIDGDPAATLVPGGAAVTYAVGRQGLYRTDDGGATWATAGPVPPDGQVMVAVDDPGLLLAGDHPPCARGGGEPAILHRSGDGGVSWRSASGGEGVQPIAAWADASLALGAACDGLRLSTDGGATWSPLGVDLASREVTTFTPIVSDGAAPGGFVATTSEGGSSDLWRLDLSDPSAPVRGPVLKEFWGIGALAARDDLVLLGAADGVWVSADAGESWDRRRAGLESVTLPDDPLVAGVPPDIEPNSFGITAVAIDPATDGRLVAGTAVGVFTSDDEGASWVRLDGADGPISALAIAPDGQHIFAETEDGVVVLT